MIALQSIPHLYPENAIRATCSLLWTIGVATLNVARWERGAFLLVVFPYNGRSR